MFDEMMTVICAPFYELHKVYSLQQSPSEMLVTYFLKLSRCLGIWPDELNLKQRYYKWHTAFVVVVFTIYVATIGAAIFTVGTDIVVVGESIACFLGVALIYFKTLITLFNCNQINEIVKILNILDSKSKNLKNERIIRLRRYFFMGPAFATLGFYIISVIFSTTLSLQPLVTTANTPVPSFFPFDIQNASKNPWGYKIVCTFQMFAVIYSLVGIISTDVIGAEFIVQSSLNLRILSIQLRELGKNRNGDLNILDELRDLVEFHQLIIKVNEKANKVYNLHYVLQLSICSLMLGLTLYESLLTIDQPMVAIKFLVFMIVATLQLLYWCVAGNMVYFDSQDIADAAFEAATVSQSTILQRNLMFIIQRAQTPLKYCGKPFLPFTFETFSTIMSISYRAFTLVYNSTA